MLRSDITTEYFHTIQVGTLPDHFGARVKELGEGRMHMECVIKPWMMAPNGFLHAASVVMLADTCAGYATIAHLPDGAKGFTTVELKNNFLGTSKVGLLRAESIAEHIGRSTHVWSAAVFNDENRKIALFRCTQLILW